MNQLAQDLIQKLRFDPHTRKHFSIKKWEGRNTCGTVGCIAGTAIYMAKPGKSLQQAISEFYRESNYAPRRNGLVKNGAAVLGIATTELAWQLFIPDTHWIGPLRSEGTNASFLSSLGPNSRPDLSTVARMIAWANAAPRDSYHPTHCANALEALLKHDRQYVDWAEAWEPAEA